MGGRGRVRRGLDNRWDVPREGARAQEEGEESTRERAQEGETWLGQSMGRTKGGRKSARERGGEHAREGDREGAGG